MNGFEIHPNGYEPLELITSFSVAPPACQQLTLIFYKDDPFQSTLSTKAAQSLDPLVSLTSTAAENTERCNHYILRHL